MSCSPRASLAEVLSRERLQTQRVGDEQHTSARERGEASRLACDGPSGRHRCSGGGTNFFWERSRQTRPEQPAPADQAASRSGWEQIRLGADQAGSRSGSEQIRLGAAQLSSTPCSKRRASPTLGAWGRFRRSGAVRASSKHPGPRSHEATTGKLLDLWGHESCICTGACRVGGGVGV